MEDAKRKRAAEIAEAKRLAELRLKNPETQAWTKYKEKKEQQFARGNATFIEVSTKTDYRCHCFWRGGGCMYIPSSYIVAGICRMHRRSNKRKEQNG